MRLLKIMLLFSLCCFIASGFAMVAGSVQAHGPHHDPLADIIGLGGLCVAIALFFVGAVFVMVRD